jgi:N-acetylglucosaminyl-diphospho-decaprenol L-rhamnosyltransferase
VSVVVVNWNSGDGLARLVESIERHPPSLSLEVVVVDNASRDHSAELAERPWLRVIRLGRNTGLAAGNNFGIRSSAGPCLLICNPDVELPPGAIDHMAEVLRRHPRCAWVVPGLVGPDGRRQTSAGDLPTLTEALLGRRLSRHLGRDGRGMWWHDWPHDEEMAIGRGAEACYLVRRSAIEDIGLQDERFRLDWEGVDWAARARAAGWEIWFDPATSVVHAGGVSIRQAPLRWVLQSHRGMYLYFAARTHLVSRPLLAAAVGLRAAAKLVSVLAGRPLYERAHRVGGDDHR